jgi:hypothetical protein
MHRILLRTICFDLPADVHDAGLEFWHRTLQAQPRRGVHYPEYHGLEHPATVTQVFVQNVGAASSRVHLDIESDDQRAEVARLLELGATVVAEHASATVGDWTVLRDPGGLLFCVVAATVDDEFVARAVAIG